MTELAAPFARPADLEAAMRRNSGSSTECPEDFVEPGADEAFRPRAQGGDCAA